MRFLHAIARHGPAARLCVAAVLLALGVSQNARADEDLLGDADDLGDERMKLIQVLYDKAGYLRGFGALLVHVGSYKSTALAKSVPSYGALVALPQAPEAKCLAVGGAAFHPSGRFAYASAGIGNPARLCGYTIDASTGSFAPMAGTPVDIASYPGGVAIDPSGHFLYAVGGNPGTVAAYALDSTTGRPTAIAGSPFATGGYLPQAVAIDRGGRFVYVGNERGSSQGTIAVFALDRTTGALTHVPGSPFDSDDPARSFALTPDGRFLYVTGYSLKTYAVNPTTGAITQVAVQSAFFPGDVAVDPTGRFLYATDVGSFTVRGFAIGANGSLTPTGGTQSIGPAVAGFPKGMTIAGDLVYVANTYAELVHGFRIDPAHGALAPITGSPFGTSNDPRGLAARAVLPKAFDLDIGDTLAGTYGALGGRPPYTWSVTAGSLPPGLSLNALTGVISGTVTVAGTYVFTLQTADSAGKTAVRDKLIGVVGSGGGGAAVPVVEFYNAGLDHYFITWAPDEIAKLDAGTVIKGWTRTGESFPVYTAGQTGTSPVCRFYIPPSLGDSHFFGRGTTECDATGLKNPSFVLEAPGFMQVFLPVGGVCPTGTLQVYRVFSNRPDANHRYMTNKAIRDQMVARGWLAEGDGPDLVVMCAPQS